MKLWFTMLNFNDSKYTLIDPNPVISKTDHLCMGGVDKNEMWSDVGRWGDGGGSEFPWRPIFIFFIKENWVCAITRHYVELHINILLTRNLPIESVSDSETIPQWYHCIVCGLNRTMEHVVNLNVTWLGFVFVLISFVHTVS